MEIKPTVKELANNTDTAGNTAVTPNTPQPELGEHGKKLQLINNEIEIANAEVSRLKALTSKRLAEEGYASLDAVKIKIAELDLLKSSAEKVKEEIDGQKEELDKQAINFKTREAEVSKRETEADKRERNVAQRETAVSTRENEISTRYEYLLTPEAKKDLANFALEVKKESEKIWARINVYRAWVKFFEPQPDNPRAYGTQLHAKHDCEQDFVSGTKKHSDEISGMIESLVSKVTAGFNRWNKGR